MIAPPSQPSPLPVVSDLEYMLPVNSTIRQSRVLTQADIQQASEVPDGYCGWDVDIGVDTEGLLRLLDFRFRGDSHVVDPGLPRNNSVSFSLK